MSKPGDRVGAILGSDAETKTLEFLGYGVYEGDHDKTMSMFGSDPVTMKNPRIKLDNGDTVWGCECWWGPEEDIRNHVIEAMAHGFKVVDIKIDTAKARSMSS